MSTEERFGIRVRSKFQRSVRLDTDFDRADALDGYILQASPRTALQTVARHINESTQRAFTWTGPYGGGKSSLALALALLAGGNTAARKASRRALNIEDDDEIARAFGGRKPWLVLPVVGRRETIDVVLGAAIDHHAPLRGRKPTKNDRRDVISELLRRADSGEYSGVLLILDELGKLLEHAATVGDDIFFYQELAEAASRSDGTLVVIGVLHQAFEQYATRLGREVREEWAKVQGRFVDIPIVAATDEVVELIGGALECTVPHPKSARAAKNVAAAIRRRRPASSSTLADSFDRCWPLHPVTAALLGPTSRRRFGQNERSVFGFLTSAEPLGFRDFLISRSTDNSLEYYSPARYWDYLRANLETAILSSPDGHRWAIGAEAVERTEARFGEPHVSLVKTVGLIELFRNGSGLVAEIDVLRECAEGTDRDGIDLALEQLAAASILIYRKHLKAWGVFAGSDFDIEAAVTGARSALGPQSEAQLQALGKLPVISARRHYAETGTLRWFDRIVMPAASAGVHRADPGTAAHTGTFLLLMPSAECSEQKALKIASDLSEASTTDVVLYGVPRGPENVLEQAAEMAALEQVARTTPELEGDAVARREIDARIRQLRGELEGALRDAFVDARWFYKGEQHDTNRHDGLSPLASEVCRKVFSKSPRIHSELVNRDVLPSSAAKAQRMLLHRMIAYGGRPNLDYDGYPADAGLYYTVISGLGIHRSRGNEASFVPPDQLDGHAGARSLVALWQKTRALLDSASGPVTLAEIYAVWRDRPYGLKDGVLPILALAYLLTYRSELAVYVDGMFAPELTEAGVDEWLQDPTRIAWKAVRIDAAAKKLLTALAKRLEEVVQRPVAADPLDSARALVAMALALPQWTQRTAHLSERTRKVRTLLLRASDPVKVIFADLPELLATHESIPLVNAVGEIIAELNGAYGLALRRIIDRLLKAIDHSGDLDDLRKRALVVQGISGDFKLDAFAGRLQSFRSSLADAEGLIALATSKPPKEFTDHDLDHASLQLSKWAFEFRRVEALASIQGRTAGRRALAVVFGGGKTISGSFDVAENDGEQVRALADSMLDRLLGGKVSPDVFLAAIVEAGARVLDMQHEETTE